VFGIVKDEMLDMQCQVTTTFRIGRREKLAKAYLVQRLVYWLMLI
jgi:hypothetical protein